ncbi:MAG: universal stress protein, partial [Myxococcota bacterium]|nr:universal stress protein [Myxococcota bacterium]
SALAEEAERSGAALLVAGVHRRGGGLRGLGHTAGHLVVHAPCPVLLVHADDGARAAPEDPAHRPRALVALEPDDAAAAAAADALRLLAPPDREDGGFELVLLEAVHAPALALGGEAHGHDARHAERRSPELAALERAAARLRARGHAVPELEEPARVTASELLERAEARDVDLVVTALRHGGLLGRVGGGAAGRAAPRLPCPLLAVPLPEDADA